MFYGYAGCINLMSSTSSSIFYGYAALTWWVQLGVLSHAYKSLQSGEAIPQIETDL